MKKHFFQITNDGVILLMGIPVPQKKVLEFLESQKVQLENHEKALTKIFDAVREIRDREVYVKGLIGIENYISELLTDDGSSLELTEEEKSKLTTSDEFMKMIKKDGGE